MINKNSIHANISLSVSDIDDLIIRVLHENESDLLFQLVEYNREYLKKWLPWLDINNCVKDSELFIRNCLNEIGNKTSLNCGLWQNNILVGVVGFHSFDWVNRKTTMGFWLDDKHQGRGVMTSSCRKLVDFAITILGMNRVAMHCAADNAKSRAIPERLGFIKEGQIRQCEWLYDHFVDHIIYSVLAEDWNGKDI